MINNISFRFITADHNVCMGAANNPTGEIYYDYILCYVDDILCISHEARQTMGDIKNNVTFKNNNIEEPDFYSGARLNKKELNNQIMC